MRSTPNDSSSRPCLWMAAGLLSYRLCDREFDCERCPLDAALRGDAPPRTGLPSSVAARRPAASQFPSDRLYSDGHTWVLPRTSDHSRFGLDAFAAGLLGSLSRITPYRGDDRPDRSATRLKLQLEGGSLVVHTPFGARIEELNPHLYNNSSFALLDPYGDGWLATIAKLSEPEQGKLVAAPEALDRSQRDLRLFRRRVALEMLADSRDLGSCLPDGGRPLTDLRQMLGATRYVHLLRELIR